MAVFSLSTTPRGITMNKDQVKGSIKGAVGKAQEAAGKAVGSDEQRMKGLRKQVEGKAQKAVGDLKEVAKDIGRR
jgi:uncharacterized protein YjbJ (UPF0337 family)